MNGHRTAWLLLAILGCNDQTLSTFNAFPEAEIISHADGASILEGYPELFSGQVSDPDHGPEDLLVTWLVGEETRCAAAAPDATGLSECELVVYEGDTELTLAVVDPQNAGSSALLTFNVVPTDAPVVDIVSPVSNEAYFADQAIIFNATVTDDHDSASSLDIWWECAAHGQIDTGMEVTIDGAVSGFATLPAGEHPLTLYAEDTAGKIGSDSVVIDVGDNNSAPTCEITEPATQGAGGEGDAISFAAVVSDAETAAESLNVSWSSDLQGTLGSSVPDSSGDVAFSTEALGMGMHVVTMTVADEIGASCTDTVPVVIGVAPTISLDSPTTGDVVEEGGAILFSATISDDTTDPVDMAMSWVSDIDGEFSTTGADSSGEARFTWTDLSSGRHQIAVTVTDEDGITSTALVDVTVDGLPSAPTVSISPNPASASDSLNAVIDVAAVDPEGDTLIYGYTWYRDGVLSTASSSSVLPSSATTRDELWKVVVVANDGIGDGDPGEASLTIANTAPTISSVTISPDPAGANDVLTCSYSGFSDSDGDSDITQLAWTINGSSAGTGSTLASGYVAGDVIVCTVTPYDGTDFGTALTDTLTIGNSAPVLADVELSPDPATEADTLTCTPGSTTDSDGTTKFTYKYAWLVDGADPGVLSSTLLPSYFAAGESVVCVVTPNDGIDDGAAVTSNTVTISNTAPSISSVTISPNPAKSNDTLTCSYSGYTDIDGDADQSTYVWEVNGSVAGAASTLSGVFTRGNSVSCTVTPYDGIDDGTALSDTVTIENSEPEISAVSISPSSPGTEDTLTATVTATDADGDSITLTYSWYVNGTYVTSGSSLDSSYTEKGDVIYVAVEPDDGTATGNLETSSSVTVGNTAPSAPTVSISPEYV